MPNISRGISPYRFVKEQHAIGKIEYPHLVIPDAGSANINCLECAQFQFNGHMSIGNAV